MLKEIIGKGYYSFEQHFDDWQEAIRAGYRTLLEAGVVEDIYVQAVIDCVYRYRTGYRHAAFHRRGKGVPWHCHLLYEGGRACGF